MWPFSSQPRRHRGRFGPSEFGGARSPKCAVVYEPAHQAQRFAHAWRQAFRLSPVRAVRLGAKPLACGLAVVWVGAGCAAQPQATKPTHQPVLQLHRFEFTQPQMGVPFRIVLYASNQQAAAQAATAAFARVAALNDLFSNYETDSEINRLSQASGQGRVEKVSADLWRVLVQAQQLARRSGGAFDVTVGPVANLWRRARRLKRLPEPDRLRAARAAVGYQYLRLDASRQTVELLRPDMRLDLGGIAKGYAADAALAVLQQHGISRALVDASGDMAVGDPPPDRPAWRIGLERPDRTNATEREFLLLSRAAVATSGDLYQHVEIDGIRYSHIVDPRTGLALTNRCFVTVIAPDCTTADSLATAASVLEPEAALRLVRATPGAAVRIIRPTGEGWRQWQTHRFEQLVVRAGDPRLGRP